MIRRVGVVAAVFAVGCLLVAGLVATAIRTSVPDAVVVGLVSGVLGSTAPRSRPCWLFAGRWKGSDAWTAKLENLRVESLRLIDVARRSDCYLSHPTTSLTRQES